MEEKKSNPVGRPSSYKPEYCELLIEHMEQGLSFESFAGLVNTCKQTIYSWTEKHPEFLDAKKRAFEKSRLFWEKIGIEGLFMGGKDNPFQASIFIFNMKNRFNWSDRREVEVNSNSKIEINIDSDDSKL